MTEAEDITAAEAEALERALLIGLARQPLPAIGLLGAGHPAQALALLAQRRRFVRPPALQSAKAPRILPGDPRPVLSEAARKSLIRLVEASNRNPVVTTLLVGNAIQRIATLSQRLHPFDLPRLTAVLKRNAAQLSPVERAYLAMLEPGTAVAADGIDAATWTEFPRAARAAFLQHQRRADPEQARDLLQSCWAGEPAAMRGELVTALRPGLSAADRPFLEQAAGDRAETVRRAATALLADLPGTPAHDERVAKAVARFSRDAGKIAATVEPKITFGAILDELACVTLDRLAAHLGLAVPDLVALARIDEPVAFLAIMALAARAGRAGIVAELLRRAAGTPWDVYATTVFPVLAELPLADRLALLPSLGPLALDPLPESTPWFNLAGLVGGVLPDADAAAILASPSWQNFKTACRDDKFAGGHEDDVAALAALMPAPFAVRLAAEIADLPLRNVLPIQEFAAFVSALDAATPAA